MAKFMMVVSREYSSSKVKSFDKKYQDKNIKKKLKCNDVIQLIRNNGKWSECGSYFGIDSCLLGRLSHVLNIASKDALLADEIVNYATRKFFICSEDAEQTAFCMDVLVDDVFIKFFELNVEEIDSLIAVICAYRGSEEAIEKVNEAIDLISTLKDIECECDLQILYRGADEDVSEKLYELEGNLEIFREDIKNIVGFPWDSKVMA